MKQGLMIDELEGRKVKRWKGETRFEFGMLEGRKVKQGLMIDELEGRKVKRWKGETRFDD
ncbi:MAG: hypothetical protein PHO32_08310 [Candidatus Cloacimonetes bacterium]|nr:hypothetical protein [Candidatus Cloacimonadota bacterium]